MSHLLAQSYEPAVAIAQLRTHPRNAREGDAGAIYESIEANGFYGAVIVQRGTNYILAGNHRYLALKAHGDVTCPVIWADVDDEKALRILLADNRTSDLGAYNNHMLAELVSSVRANEGGLDGTGWDDDALQNLMDDLAGLHLGDLSGDPSKPERKQVVSDRDVVQPQTFEAPNATVKTPVEHDDDPNEAPGEVKTPPAEFKSFDETIPTDYKCPSCQYTWSGSTGGEKQAA